MADIEKVIKALEECVKYDYSCKKCPYKPKSNDEEKDCSIELTKDALELLKEQEAVVKQWKKEIADNQLAHAPNDSHEFMSLNEHLENEYKRGIWDGLQIAWNIISEGR